MRITLTVAQLYAVMGNTVAMLIVRCGNRIKGCGCGVFVHPQTEAEYGIDDVVMDDDDKPARFDLEVESNADAFLAYVLERCPDGMTNYKPGETVFCRMPSGIIRECRVIKNVPLGRVHVVYKVNNVTNSFAPFAAGRIFRTFAEASA